MTPPPSRRPRLLAGPLLAVLFLFLPLAACSQEGGSDAALGAESAGSAAGGSAEADAGDAAARDEAARDEAVRDEAAEPGSDGAARTGVDVTRAVISTGTVSLWAEDVGAARREVRRVLDAERGVVGDEQTDTEDGEVVYTRLVVRVPATRFESAMSALEDVGRLRGSTRGSEDVTAEVIDVDARLRAQEASLRRVERLLGEAASLKDVVAIEGELTRRQADLDSLAGRQRWLADQTALSTITVDVERPPDTGPGRDEEEPVGFVAGLREGLSALSATVSGVLTVTGVLLPFGAAFALLAVPTWVALRRLGRSRRGRPGAPAGGQVSG